ncbi:MAG: ATP-binding protein [Geitlerinemataceae cyanobacterium]
MTEQSISNHKFSNCEQDPIHIPGCIQPHGILLVLQEPELTILQVSENIFEVLNIKAEDLIGCKLSEVLGSKQIEFIQKTIGNRAEFQEVNPIALSIQKDDRVLDFNGTIHRADGSLILELERLMSSNISLFLNVYRLTKKSVQVIQKAEFFTDMCRAIVQEIRKMTGFDRVMLYQLDSCKVLAEDKMPHLKSYQGLRFPSTDIPERAKNLYLEKWLRMIPDRRYQPVAIFPTNHPDTGCPTDLTNAGLRSIHPLHLEYLENMGVIASMSISIVKNRKLWGLIVCHHETPKYVSYELRDACEFLAQTLSSQIVDREQRELKKYELELSNLYNSAIESIFQEDDFLDGLVLAQMEVFKLRLASGIFVCMQRCWQSVGRTPKEIHVHNLLRWLNKQPEFQVFHTNCLSSVYPKAESFTDIASGLLVIAISPGQYILWFRPEVIQIVEWAGNPEYPAEAEDESGLNLRPRKSFEFWQERVEKTALPWQEHEIESAKTMRRAIVDIVLHQVNDLTKMNNALEKSEAKANRKARQLEKTLAQLQETQAQLIQSEKMSSLGRLVAGIAHEINNPLNFIHANIGYLENYTQDLIELVCLYQQKTLNSDEEICVLEEEIDLNFLQQDLPSVVKSARVGSERIREIVRSLSHFSRTDEKFAQPIDIHHALEESLLILSGKLKSKSVPIEIIKKYGKISLVECYPTQLEQVFLNLLTNSIDALRKKNKNKSLEAQEIRPSRILIQTAVETRTAEEGYIWAVSSITVAVIRITDNGSGIPESIQTKIFDPFFTTKNVGDGIGLGLSISYQIVVDRHRGKLSFRSVEGEGTEFTIEIPIRQPRS